MRQPPVAKPAGIATGITTEIARDYHRDGYASPVRIVGTHEALAHRARLETAEAQFGPLHYRSKAHTILTSPGELATHPHVLDIIEAMIGPDILLFNATYIIKEAQTQAHVSWHQDLTFWGLSHDDQVSMWLALSPATPESGCMRMIPASHEQGRVRHDVTKDGDNVLLQGQTVPGVDEAGAVMCPLAPGEASFHHGWTLHASMPNNSDERRIGLNVQYLAPHVRQTKHDLDTALLVRGRDEYRHFGDDVLAGSDLDPGAVRRQEALEALYVKTVGAA
jgi:phytanoyl-CoA dioxygenase PhyH